MCSDVDTGGCTTETEVTDTRDDIGVDRVGLRDGGTRCPMWKGG